jgi:hypothetical protein
MLPLLDIILINSLSFLVGFGLGCYCFVKGFLMNDPSDKVVQSCYPVEDKIKKNVIIN